MNWSAIQDKFNWGSVGLAALAGGVGGALGADGLFKNGAFSGVKSGAVQSALRGATSSALTQGIAVASGLQDKFSWAGVAAAGAAAGAGYFAGKTLGATPLKVDNSLSNQLAHFGMSTAALLASAATRSALEGTSFGDSVMAGLPDVIGQAISDAAINGVSLPKEQVEATPTSGGGFGGYRSGGSQLEDKLKSQYALGAKNIPEKFGGGSNPMFDYSMHLSGDDLGRLGQYISDVSSRTWDEVKAVFEPVRAAVEDEIVVIGNKLDWLIDEASLQGARIAANNSITQKFTTAASVVNALGFSNAARQVYAAGQVPVGFEQKAADFVVGVARLGKTAFFSPLQSIQAGIRVFGNAFDATVMANPADTANASLGIVKSGAKYVQRLASNAVGITQGNAAAGRDLGGQGFEIATVVAPELRALNALKFGRLGIAAETVVPEGVVYSRIDLTGEVLPYVGQTKTYERYLERQIEHARAYPDADFEFTIVDRANPGGDLDVAEHNYIQQLTGGIRASKSPLVSNLKDPVGPARRLDFGLPEPRGW